MELVEIEKKKIEKEREIPTQKLELYKTYL